MDGALRINRKFSKLIQKLQNYTQIGKLRLRQGQLGLSQGKLLSWPVRASPVIARLFVGG